MSKRQTAESQCDKCQARILWARSSTGGSIPLDLRPHKITAASEGPFYLLNDFDMICTRLDLPMIERAIEQGRSLFSNHLVTCTERNGERNAA